MSLQLQGLRTAGYKVTDLDKAKEWYTSVLGIEPYFDQPFYVGYNVAGYELGLMPVEGNESAGGGTGMTAYWGVSDVKASFDVLIQKGATPIEQPADVGDDIMVASVRDPWGNTFGIIYNPHFVLPAH